MCRRGNWKCTSTTRWEGVICVRFRLTLRWNAHGRGNGAYLRADLSRISSLSSYLWILPQTYIAHLSPYSPFVQCPVNRAAFARIVHVAVSSSTFVRYLGPLRSWTGNRYSYSQIPGVPLRSRSVRSQGRTLNPTPSNNLQITSRRRARYASFGRRLSFIHKRNGKFKLWWLPGLVTRCMRIFVTSLPTLVRLFNQFFKLSYESGFSLSPCNQVSSQLLINLLFKTLIRFLTRGIIQHFTQLCLLFGERFNASITLIPSSRSFLCRRLYKWKIPIDRNHEHRFYATAEETSLFQTQTLISVYNAEHSVPGDNSQRCLAL